VLREGLKFAHSSAAYSLAAFDRQRSASP